MRLTLTWLGLCVLVAGAGCAPVIPFHAAETADVLKAKQVAVTVAGGGGNGSGSNQPVDHCCGGGGVRVRVGVGHDQEVGAEMTAIGIGADKIEDGTVYLAGKARYKLGIGRHLAFVAGLGGAGAIPVTPQRLSSPAPLVLGADVALLASTSPLAGRVQVYGGARFTTALPATSDFYANAPTELFTVPVGLALTLSPRWALFFEGGFLAAISEYEGTTDHSVRTNNYFGGYAAAAVQYTTGPL